MGGVAVERSAVFNPQEYSMVAAGEGDGACRVVRNNITGHQLEEHRLYFSDGKEYEKYLEVTAWRRNRKHVAGAVYLLCSSQANLCGTMHSATLYLERSGRRLHDMRKMSTEQGNQLMKACLQGFGELFRKFGYFSVEDSMVWLDGEGEAWVWLNENRSLAQPYRAQMQHGDEQLMIMRVVEVVEEHIDNINPSNTFMSFVRSKHKRLTFQQTLATLDEYIINCRTIESSERLSTIDSNILENLLETRGGESVSTAPTIKKVDYAPVPTRLFPNTVNYIKPHHPKHLSATFDTTPKAQQQLTGLHFQKTRPPLQLSIQGRMNIKRQLSPRFTTCFAQPQLSTRVRSPSGNITFSYQNKPAQNKHIPTPVSGLLKPVKASEVENVAPQKEAVYYEQTQPSDKFFTREQYISTHSEEVDHPFTEQFGKENVRPFEKQHSGGLVDLHRILSEKVNIAYKLGESQIGESITSQPCWNAVGTDELEAPNKYISRLEMNMSESRLASSHQQQSPMQPHHPFIRLEPTDSNTDTFSGMYYYGAEETVELDPEIAADLLMIGL